MPGSGAWTRSKGCKISGIESAPPLTFCSAGKNFSAASASSTGEILISTLLSSSSSKSIVRAVHELIESEGDSVVGRVVIQDAGWIGGQHRMVKPLSNDLRKRV